MDSCRVTAGLLTHLDGPARYSRSETGGVRGRAWLATATIKSTWRRAFAPQLAYAPCPAFHITCQFTELKGLLAKLPQHKRLLAT